jgi:hypothetical protein
MLTMIDSRHGGGGYIDERQNRYIKNVVDGHDETKRDADGWTHTTTITGLR